MRAALLLLPWLLVGLAWAAWVGSSDHPGLAHGLGLLIWLLGTVAVWLVLRRPAAGILRWDGLQWLWETAGGSRVGTVRPCLDWQQGLLLEFSQAGHGSCWIWPERHSAPLYWEALRRAVFAAVTPGDPPGHPSARGGGHG